MQRDEPQRPNAAAAEAARAAAFARKQRWKEQPGNRYTAEELKRMSEEFGPFTIETPRPMEMFID